MKYKITHTTIYYYEYHVTFCHNRAVLKPRQLHYQKLLDFQLNITPTPSEIDEYTDFFGNNVTQFLVQQSHQELKVISSCEIERNTSTILESRNTVEWQKLTLSDGLSKLKSYKNEELDFINYILPSPLIPPPNEKITKYAEESFHHNRSIFDSCLELNQRIFKDFKFTKGHTDVLTSVEKVFEERKGVCQDFTQIAISCVRAVGLPARYVSGYLETLPPPGKEKLVGVDATHAWFSIYIPSFGWLDLDPTNNLIPSDQHITVAWGRDYSDIVPLKGIIYSTGKNKLNVAVDVTRIS